MLDKHKGTLKLMSAMFTLVPLNQFNILELQAFKKQLQVTVNEFVNRKKILTMLGEFSTVKDSIVEFCNDIDTFVDETNDILTKIDAQIDALGDEFINNLGIPKA